MGCRRQMVQGMVGEIVGRSAVAALAVLLLAAAIATLVVGGMVEPIERLTAQLWAKRGPPGADEESDLDEVEQIRRALGVVGQAIGLERSAIAGLTLSLAQRAREDGPALVAPPSGRAWLAIVLSDGAQAEELALCAEAVAREAARQGGAFTRIGGRAALAEWGAELDDALRATLGARGLADALATEALCGHVVIVVGAGDDARGWQEPAEAALKRSESLVTMLMGPGASADAGEHVVAEPLEAAGEFVRIVGMAEPPELRDVAREPED